MVKRIILVSLISFLSIFSFLGKGLPPTHDGEYHVVRFYEFDKSLKDGNLYPRWAPDLNNGFGVPLFNYVYPLPNYFSSLFHLFGSSFIDAFKLNMLFSTIIGSVFMFLWAKEFWGEPGGLISSAFFSFSPYRILDTYVRGSVGEVWAMSLFPLFLWSITKYSKSKKNKFTIMSSISFALVIFSHNILALMFMAFALLYITFVLDRKLLLRNFITLLWGVGLSSIFWFPAILETVYVRGLQIYNYSDNFPELYQLIFPSWGTGFSSGSLSNQLSFQIGLANLLAVLASFFLLFKKNFNKKIIYFSLAIFSAVILLMLRISLPLWRIIPLMNYFQFPWRFLSIEVLIASFLAGSLTHLWKPRILGFLMVAFVIILGFGYAKVAYFLVRPDSYYATRSNFIDGTNSPGNTFNTIWFVNQPKQKNKVVTSAKIQDLRLKSTEYDFKSSSDRDESALINTAYFPGWNYYIDNKKEPLKRTKEGLFSIVIPKGVHQNKVVLENTGPQSLGTLISLISILALLLWNFRFDRIKR